MSLVKLGVGILILALGFGLGVLYMDSQPVPILPPINIPIEVTKEQEEKIDSLKLEIEEREKLINNLRDSSVVIDSTRIDKIEEVRELPITEAAQFLTIKLREYEDKF